MWITSSENFIKTRLWVVVFLLVAALSGQAAAADKGGYGLPLAEPEKLGLSSERLARIWPAMQSFIDKGQVPGLLTLVARHGKVVHLETQGYADRKQRKPLHSDTIFRLYSMTKPITAVAAMILYEEGRFRLDDPIADYLPELGQMKVYTENGLVDATQPITVRQLLTHTAGLTFTGSTNVPAVSKMYQKAELTSVAVRLSGITLEDYVKKHGTVPLVAQPGTRWEYSDSFNVLSRLVEVLSGQSYGEFLSQRLFRPLGMVDTAFHVPKEKVARLAALYTQNTDGALVPSDGVGGDFSRRPSLEAGSSGLVGTAADYLRFAQMLLNGGELEGVRILSPSTVRLMLSNHLPAEFGPNPLASLSPHFGKGLGFGFAGLVVMDAVANGTAGSNGEYSWGGAASTNFWIDPARELIGMVFTQVIPARTPLAVRERMHQMTYQAVVEG